MNEKLFYDQFMLVCGSKFADFAIAPLLFLNCPLAFASKKLLIIRIQKQEFVASVLR